MIQSPALTILSVGPIIRGFRTRMAGVVAGVRGEHGYKTAAGVSHTPKENPQGPVHPDWSYTDVLVPHHLHEIDRNRAYAERLARELMQVPVS
ncbi:hypothetical protein BJX61DRAFT_505493 [Aspergillus egyptiacus]|nr:hypothetical protein BJX61DRAFT_505493 [Aspergillus egyptiacus]